MKLNVPELTKITGEKNENFYFELKGIINSTRGQQLKFVLHFFF